MIPDGLVLSFAIALGVGLLIGAERERRNRDRPTRQAAGIRTFAVASLMGAASFALGGALVLSVALAAAAGFAALSYWRGRQDDDPGLTTEIALVLTVLNGALTIREPGLAAGLGVGLAILLAARTPLHRFVGAVLTPREARAALALAASSLIVLPLLPDRTVGPFDALNPRSIWIVVILVMAIGAVAHVAVRALGTRLGLPIAGLASGFISSSATIAAMASRAARAPAARTPAAAGAVLSTVATVVQLAAVLAAVSVATLQALATPLALAGVAAAAYAAAFSLRALRKPAEDGGVPEEAISLPAALVFGATLSAVLLGAAALQAWLGEGGAILAAAVAGLADAHAAAFSIASLVAAGRLTPAEAVLPILAGFTTNTVTKLAFAAMGGRAFALRVAPGLLLVAAAAWAGALVTLLAR